MQANMREQQEVHNTTQSTIAQGTSTVQTQNVASTGHSIIYRTDIDGSADQADSQILAAILERRFLKGRTAAPIFPECKAWTIHRSSSQPYLPGPPGAGKMRCRRPGTWWTPNTRHRMNDPSSRAEPNASRSIFSSAVRLIAVWLGQTARLYVAPRPNVAGFPSNRAFPMLLSMPVLAMFFFSSLQQGVGFGLDAAFTGVLALVAMSSIQFQPNVRVSSAFVSALFLGSLVGYVLQWIGISPTILDLMSVWVVLVSLRVSLGMLSEGR